MGFDHRFGSSVEHIVTQTKETTGASVPQFQSEAKYNDEIWPSMGTVTFAIKKKKKKGGGRVLN